MAPSTKRLNVPRSTYLAFSLKIFERPGDDVTSFAQRVGSDTLSSQGVTLMPPRSKVAMLPQALRDELERRMVERGFSGYEELADWLQKQGYQIAEDSMQRHGAKLRQKMESLKNSTLQAMAIAHAAGRTTTTSSISLSTSSMTGSFLSCLKPSKSTRVI
jgi:Bacteriophage Mu, Gp27